MCGLRSGGCFCIGVVDCQERRSAKGDGACVLLGELYLEKLEWVGWLVEAMIRLLSSYKKFQRPPAYGWELVPNVELYRVLLLYKIN